MNRTLFCLVCGGLFAVALCSPFRVRAADHSNLDEGLPTQVVDATPIEYGGREFQTALEYDHTGRGRDLFVVEPRVEWGFARNWQGTVGVPFVLGSGTRDDGLGQVNLEALYNFNTETLILPAFAASARLDLPTGPDRADGGSSHGVDTTLQFIATKTLGRTSFLNQIHLNAAWLHNQDRQPGERGDRYRLILGYSVRLNADTIGIVDFIRQQETERGQVSNTFEVGIRRQLTPLDTLSLGVGAGIGHDSPDVRALCGIQHSF